MCSTDPGENYRRIAEALPPEVALVVAVKGRTAAEIGRVIAAGAAVIGENYVQEARRHRLELGPAAERVEWHMIGHLQRNKVNPALRLFDCIQGVDSLRLAAAVNRRAERTVPVYIEVNIAGEESKHGAPPDEVPALAAAIAEMENLRLEGLMTMEPYHPDPERARPHFRRMRELFEECNRTPALGQRLRALSMGMSNSYRVALEEGANMIRLGTAVFGPSSA